MQILINVIRKEWRDAIRDRRSIGASLMFAVFGPVMVYLALDSLGNEVDQTGAMQVAVVGAEHAPTLVTKLSEQGIQWTHFETSEEVQLTDDLRVLVTIPDHYAQRYQALNKVDIAVMANYKDGKAESQSKRVAKLINAYGQKVSRSRLVATGVNPDTIVAIQATTYDLSQAGGETARISSALIYVFLIAGFVSGAFMAADSVAGERERHSLESLLAQPVKPLTLVTGKWLTTGAISMFVSTATLVIGGVFLAKAPLEVLGLRLFIDPASIALGALVLLPLALLAVALQMLVAARARTYKEAGTYTQFTLFLPIVIAGAGMLGNVDVGAMGQVLPIFSQTTALRDILLEGSAAVGGLLLGAASTLLVAAGLVWLTAQRLGDERSL